MLPSLTKAQKKIYDFYKQFIARNWYSPTYATASQALDITESAIHKHISNLSDLWYVSKDKSWNVSVSNNSIRILWHVSCWSGIEIIEDEIETVDVPSKMLAPWFNYYGLIAKWDSMINANIADNDILVIRQQNDIESWEIWVVVKDDDTVTLKRVFKRSADILLKPENNDFEPMLLKDCQIRGKLVWVIRNFHD